MRFEIYPIDVSFQYRKGKSKVMMKYHISKMNFDIYSINILWYFEYYKKRVKYGKKNILIFNIVICIVVWICKYELFLNQ